MTTLIGVTVVFVAMMIAGGLLLGGNNDGLMLMGILSGLAGTIGTIVMIFLILSWVASANRAKFVNKEYGTSFTTEDVFWNDDIINKTILGSKHNINLSDTKK